MNGLRNFFYKPVENNYNNVIVLSEILNFKFVLILWCIMFSIWFATLLKIVQFWREGKVVLAGRT